MSAYRASGALCLILIDYVRPLPEVDEQMAAHVAWLDAGFDQDAFLVAGRREPRTGGVIVARGTRAAVERVAATDPFVTSGVATATVVPFNASFAAGAIREWLQ
ncbi:YciI family protein [Sphingomonas sp.]|uniref:YciI family protein n=1 Tax=Sphingomonas sp. TaxID=28214 RepID=UPI0035C875F5